MSKGYKLYGDFVRQQARERMKLGLESDRRDFFHYLLNAKDPDTGAGFTERELWAESSLLIIAGSDTSSTALAAALFYLLHNPEAMRILEAEIFSVFQDVEQIVHGAELRKCQ